MKFFEEIKDIFIGNGEEDTTNVNDEFTLGDYAMSVAALISTAIPLGMLLFIFG